MKPLTLAPHPMPLPTRSIRRSLLALLLGAMPITATAQAPALRSHAAAIADSVVAARRAGTSNDDRLLNAAIDLEAGRRTGSTELLLNSADGFYEVTVRQPRWPFGWFGLGTAKLELYRLGAREIRSPHQAPGAGWLNTSQDAFLRGLREDPDFSPAAAGLAEIALEDLDAPRVRYAERTLRGYVRTHPSDPLTTLALLRIDLRRDSLNEARDLVDSYRRSGGDPGVADWEGARLAFALGDNALGSERYYRAAAWAASRPTHELFRADLALIADSAELAAFDSTAPAELVAMLREFWGGRELEAGRPEGSRLPEHFRRVRYAYEHFWATGEIQQFGFEQIYRGAPRGLDDRAAIYIRHGDPDDRATFVGDEQTPPNESWSYFRPGGNLIFHFSKQRGTANRLIEELGVIPGNKEMLYESRANMDPLYLQLSNLFALSSARARAGVSDYMLVTPEQLRRERDQNRRMIALGTTTDSDPIELDRTWTPVAQAFGTIGTRGHTTGLLVAIALPAPKELTPIPLPGGGVGYTLRVRVTAADDAGRTTLDADSIIRLRAPRALTAGEHLSIVRLYDLPAGTLRVRVIVADSTGKVGAVRLFNGVPVVAVRADSLTISDVLVGREGSGISWLRPDGESFVLNPLNAWSPSQNLSLGFDLGGVAAGAQYTTRIAVADLGADSTTPPRSSVTFTKVGTGGQTFVTYDLGLRSLRPGRYLLTVTVQAGERTVRRERRLEILPDRR